MTEEISAGEGGEEGTGNKEAGIVAGTVSNVKKQVAELENPDYGRLILEEEKGRNRKTLIEWFNSEKKKAGEIKEEREETKEKETPKKEKIKEKKIPVEKIGYYSKKELTAEEKRLFRKRVLEKKAKPRFIRQDYPKLKRLKDVWRKPRGEDSKQAEGKRGKGRIVSIGYKKTKEIRNRHPSGFYPLIVHNLMELGGIDPVEEAAIIAGSVGRRKRNEIIKLANKKRITILNPRKGEI